MRSPIRTQCAPALLRRSHQLLSRTKPIAEIAVPVSQFDAAVTTFESRYDDWVRARRQVTVAIGDQHQAEEGLREELRGVGLAILKVGRGRRSFDVYRRYFPHGYGKSLRMSPEESLAVAAGLLAALADETVPAIVACREPLQAAVTRLESARTARQTALNARFEAKQILQDERIAWEKALQRFYFDCRYAMSDHRSYVESLFNTSGRRSTEKGAEDGEDVEPVVSNTSTAAEPVALTISRSSSADGAGSVKGPVAPATNDGEITKLAS
jgi:hypothetical protein